ncbi:MAG TPA: helix-turn-helix domain-containing protein [Pseudonocardiaceae bacterium]|jgi:AcrR family transcriptional regulator|nr:helix-turn-helix domain-containing protein [Pseudonocardiaceae bacterium]
MPARPLAEVADAAVRLFTDKGFGPAGISDVAAALGLSHGALYTYVRSKQALLYLALVRSVRPDAVDSLATPVADPTADDVIALADSWATNRAVLPTLARALAADLDPPWAGAAGEPRGPAAAMGSGQVTGNPDLFAVAKLGAQADAEQRGQPGAQSGGLGGSSAAEPHGSDESRAARAAGSGESGSGSGSGSGESGGSAVGRSRGRAAAGSAWPGGSVAGGPHGSDESRAVEAARSGEPGSGEPRSGEPGSVQAGALARPGSGEPAVAAEFGAVVDELYDFISGNRRILQLVERCSAELPDLAQWYFVGRRREMLAQLGDYLARRIESGHLAAVPDVPVAARYIVETIAWFAMHRHGDPDSAMLDDAACRRTVTHLLRTSFLGTTGGPT